MDNKYSTLGFDKIYVGSSAAHKKNEKKTKKKKKKILYKWSPQTR